MDTVFAWAGTHSLERELKPAALAGIAAGDVFIKGGFPGHAVLVADVVENRATGEKRFLLLQSYMPAQDIHVLKNPAGGGSPVVPARLRRPPRHTRMDLPPRQPAPLAVMARRHARARRHPRSVAAHDEQPISRNRCASAASGAGRCRWMAEEDGSSNPPGTV